MPVCMHIYNLLHSVVHHDDVSFTQSTNLSFKVKPGLVFYSTISQTIDTMVTINNSTLLHDPVSISVEVENLEHQVLIYNLTNSFRLFIHTAISFSYNSDGHKQYQYHRY